MLTADSDGGSPDEEWEESIRLIKANSRPWNGYWTWADKPVGERGAAEDVLAAVGLNVVDLRSRPEGQDPPDCEAMIDGKRCGIEVTELVDQKTLERSLKGQGQHFVCTQESLLEEIQKRIDRKDQTAKVKGGPYHRYILVIVTDELFLSRDAVEQFLAGANFRAGLITDAFLGLSYHPSSAPEGGSCPVFRLSLAPRMS